MRRKPRGFTTIEMLVVIGIILLLAGMLFIGGRYIFGSSRANATRVTLGNLANMLAELDAKTRRIPEISDAYSVPPLSNPLVAPGSVAKDGGDREVDGVRATIAVMVALRSMPTNRSALEQIPAEQLTTLLDDTVGTPAFDESTVPIVLDAWDNPIIFVPDGGLTAVRFQDHGNEMHIITSKGVVEFGDPSPTDTRPFFASAGEDGNFQTGDDNLYSFEN